MDGRPRRAPSKAGSQIYFGKNRAIKGLLSRASGDTNRRMTCTLYRHFDAAGTLLYVGISTAALFRLHQHKKRSDWFPRIAKITLEHYPDRPAALAAEKVAIQTENPLYNIHWWVERKKPRDYYVRKQVPHPCQGCGATIVRRRKWCVECARRRDREAAAAWAKAHREKTREYGARHRALHGPSETPEARKIRYAKTGT